MSAIQLDVTAPVTSETVTVNDMILRLDALAEGYEEVLGLAKQQLENYEVSESDWSRIASKVEGQLSYRKLSVGLATLLSDGLVAIQRKEEGTWDGCNHHELLIAELIIERLEVVLHKRIIDKALKEEIQRQTREAAKEERLNIIAQAEAAAEIKFRALQREAIESASQKEYLLSDLLHSVFGKGIQQAVNTAVETKLAGRDQGWQEI